MATPAKRSCPEAEEQPVTGYVVDVTPMRQTAPDKKPYFEGQIETSKGVVDKFVGWSPKKQAILAEFHNTKVPVKFLVPKFRIEIMPDGSNKYKLGDFTKIEGSTPEFTSGLQNNKVIATIIAVQDVKKGHNCPCCLNVITMPDNRDDEVICDSCGSMTLPDLCSEFVMVDATFRDSNKNVLPLKIQKSALENLNITTYEKKNILRSIHAMKSVEMTVRGDLVTEIIKQSDK